jgi:hypothetical protein
MIRSPRLLTGLGMQTLLDAIEHAQAPVDIELELPSGAVSLTELAHF